MGNRLDSDYEALTDDGIVKMETMGDLESDGLDAEALVSDMISWSTMRKHLNECLDEKKERKEAATNWELESIDISCNQTKKKVKTALSSFQSKGRFESDQNFDVEVQIQLCCTECPNRVPLDVALNRGYVCPDHRSGSAEEEPAIVQVDDSSSEETFYWSTSIHRTQRPSFGI